MCVNDLKTHHLDMIWTPEISFSDIFGKLHMSKWNAEVVFEGKLDEF